LKKKIVKKLSLGTVQFGIKYGLNKKKINSKNIKKIIRYVSKIKIKKIDTAISYGMSEKNLGLFFLKNYQVTTKIPAYKNSYGDPKEWTRSQIKKSLSLLKLKSLHGVLFHNPDDLFSKSGKKIYKELQRLKKNKLIKKIGISIYNFNKLDRIIKSFKIDIVQAPFNIIDRRLLKSLLFKLKKKNRIEIQVRSIFLQGLLLKNLKFKNEKFSRYKNIWTTLHSWLSINRYNIIDVCINDCLRYNLDTIVIGFENLQQLKRVINYNKIDNLRLPSNFSSNDINLINPAMWN
jgi:aryl-alcohol dehydrogenase-like predicted oxidoreductase